MYCRIRPHGDHCTYLISWHTPLPCDARFYHSYHKAAGGLEHTNFEFSGIGLKALPNFPNALPNVATPPRIPLRVPYKVFLPAKLTAIGTDLFSESRRRQPPPRPDLQLPPIIGGSQNPKAVEYDCKGCGVVNDGTHGSLFRSSPFTLLPTRSVSTEPALSKLFLVPPDADNSKTSACCCLGACSKDSGAWCPIPSELPDSSTVRTSIDKLSRRITPASIIALPSHNVDKKTEMRKAFESKSPNTPIIKASPDGTLLGMSWPNLPDDYSHLTVSANFGSCVSPFGFIYKYILENPDKVDSDIFIPLATWGQSIESLLLWTSVSRQRLKGLVSPAAHEIPPQRSLVDTKSILLHLSDIVWTPNSKEIVVELFHCIPHVEGDRSSFWSAEAITWTRLSPTDLSPDNVIDHQRSRGVHGILPFAAKPIRLSSLLGRPRSDNIMLSLIPTELPFRATRKSMRMSTLPNPFDVVSSPQTPERAEALDVERYAGIDGFGDEDVEAALADEAETAAELAASIEITPGSKPTMYLDGLSGGSWAPFAWPKAASSFVVPDYVESSTVTILNPREGFDTLLMRLPIALYGQFERSIGVMAQVSLSKIATELPKDLIEVRRQGNEVTSPTKVVLRLNLPPRMLFSFFSHHGEWNAEGDDTEVLCVEQARFSTSDNEVSVNSRGSVWYLSQVHQPRRESAIAGSASKRVPNLMDLSRPLSEAQLLKLLNGETEDEELDEDLFDSALNTADLPGESLQNEQTDEVVLFEDDLLEENEETEEHITIVDVSPNSEVTEALIEQTTVVVHRRKPSITSSSFFPSRVLSNHQTFSSSALSRLDPSSRDSVIQGKLFSRSGILEGFGADKDVQICDTSLISLNSKCLRVQAVSSCSHLQLFAFEIHASDLTMKEIAKSRSKSIEVAGNIAFENRDINIKAHLCSKQQVVIISVMISDSVYIYALTHHAHEYRFIYLHKVQILDSITHSFSLTHIEKMDWVSVSCGTNEENPILVIIGLKTMYFVEIGKTPHNDSELPVIKTHTIPIDCSSADEKASVYSFAISSTFAYISSSPNDPFMASALLTFSNGQTHLYVIIMSKTENGKSFTLKNECMRIGNDKMCMSNTSSLSTEENRAFAGISEYSKPPTPFLSIPSSITVSSIKAVTGQDLISLRRAAEATEAEGKIGAYDAPEVRDYKLEELPLHFFVVAIGDRSGALTVALVAIRLRKPIDSHSEDICSLLTTHAGYTLAGQILPEPNVSDTETLNNCNSVDAKFTETGSHSSPPVTGIYWSPSMRRLLLQRSYIPKEFTLANKGQMIELAVFACALVPRRERDFRRLLLHRQLRTTMPELYSAVMPGVELMLRITPIAPLPSVTLPAASVPSNDDGHRVLSNQRSIGLVSSISNTFPCVLVEGAAMTRKTAALLSTRRNIGSAHSLWSHISQAYSALAIRPGNEKQLQSQRHLILSIVNAFNNAALSVTKEFHEAVSNYSWRNQVVVGRSIMKRQARLNNLYSSSTSSPFDPYSQLNSLGITEASYHPGSVALTQIPMEAFWPDPISPNMPRSETRLFKQSGDEMKDESPRDKSFQIEREPSVLHGTEAAKTAFTYGLSGSTSLVNAKEEGEESEEFNDEGQSVTPRLPCTIS